MGEEGFEATTETQYAAEKAAIQRTRSDSYQHLEDLLPALPTPGTSITSLLVKSGEAARLLQISERTLWQLRHDGEIAFVPIRGAIRFRLADLVEYVIRRRTMGVSNGASQKSRDSPLAADRQSEGRPARLPVEPRVSVDQRAEATNKATTPEPTQLVDVTDADHLLLALIEAWPSLSLARRKMVVALLPGHGCLCSAQGRL